MVAKEWRDARWKFLIAAVLVLVVTLDLTPCEELHLTPYEELFFSYRTGGFVILLPLAALLGVALISGEVGGGSMYLLLSKPVSRTRVLLTKYGVCAGVLLAASALGGILLVVATAAHGCPFGHLSVAGAALSAVLIWLGALFFLGVALLASILFRGVVGSTVAAALALWMVLALPGFLDGSLESTPHGLFEKLKLYSYWSSKSLYMGRSFVPTHFLVSTVAAAAPLLAALWLFNRKAY